MILTKSRTWLVLRMAVLLAVLAALGSCRSSFITAANRKAIRDSFPPSPVTVWVEQDISGQDVIKKSPENPKVYAEKNRVVWMSTEAIEIELNDPAIGKPKCKTDDGLTVCWTGKFPAKGQAYKVQYTVKIPGMPALDPEIEVLE